MDQSAAVCYAYAIPPLRNRHSTYAWIKKDKGIDEPYPFEQ
ncbi:ribonuclease HII [Hoylesella loescheii]|nr:ribonuclease HII [Hoylesella loescheii]